jgi:hypothetical protein
MHIHGNLMNPNLASIYSAAATEKAASAQRAAEVRKKLIGSTSSSDGELDSEEILVRQWSEESSHKRQGQIQSSAPKEDQIADEEQADEPKIQIADEEQADEPISTWA